MIKKIAMFLLSGTLLGALPLNVSAAATGMQDESIGDLTYEVPEGWIVSSETSDGQITCTSSNNPIAFTAVFTPLDMSAYDQSLQKMLLSTMMNSFTEMDGYTESFNQDGTFESNYAANLRMFSYNNGDSDVTCTSYSLCSPEGIALFIIGGTTSMLDSDDYTTFTDITSSVKLSTSSSTSSSKSYTQYSAGVYKVGTDLPAGEYVVFASGSAGYFCVSSDSNQNDILFNDNFSTNSIITVNDGEYVNLSRCYAIPLSENPEVNTSASGMFKVGTHIPAGEYKIDSGTDSGYYCIYSNSRQDNIIANDNFTGQNYVTVSDGQYLVLNRCSFTEPPAKVEKTYTDSETVKKVQEALTSAGYDCGSPDGIAGSGTKAQIEKYQADHSLNISGNITDELLNTLNIN